MNLWAYLYRVKYESNSNSLIFLYLFALFFLIDHKFERNFKSYQTQYYIQAWFDMIINSSIELLSNDYVSGIELFG